LRYHERKGDSPTVFALNINKPYSQNEQAQYGAKVLKFFKGGLRFALKAGALAPALSAARSKSAEGCL